MRAGVISEFNKPWDVRQMPDPRPGPGQVLIETRAIGCNFPDILMVQGKYQVKPPLPFSPGHEIAGVVQAVGSGVTRVRPGQRVLASLEWGGYAERAVTPAERAHPIPDAMPFDQAAAFYVVSHHTAPTGMIPLPLYVETCHARGVPVVVDAAAEYGWRDMLATGADLVLFSAQKALGGPTAGIVAGRRDLVRACYAQSRGIGRPMKAGKEAVVGAIAALRRWMALDHAAITQKVENAANHVVRRLSGIPGVTAIRVPDETGNPFSRVHLLVDPVAAGFSAHGVDGELKRRRPRLILRSLQADRGLLQIDVRRLDAASLDDLCERLLAAIEAARRNGATSSPEPPADQSARSVLDWLDEN